VRRAVIESWHSTLEFELRSLEHSTTRATAHVPAWIDDYNTRRRHSALGMKSLANYEKTLQAGQAARHVSAPARPPCGNW
jgi:transposase InsO family protein